MRKIRLICWKKKKMLNIRTKKQKKTKKRKIKERKIGYLVFWVQLPQEIDLNN